MTIKPGDMIEFPMPIPGATYTIKVTAIERNGPNTPAKIEGTIEKVTFGKESIDG